MDLIRSPTSVLRCYLQGQSMVFSATRVVNGLHQLPPGWGTMLLCVVILPDPLFDTVKQTISSAVWVVLCNCIKQRSSESKTTAERQPFATDIKDLIMYCMKIVFSCVQRSFNVITSWHKI